MARLISTIFMFISRFLAWDEATTSRFFSLDAVVEEYITPQVPATPTRSENTPEVAATMVGFFVHFGNCIIRPPYAVREISHQRDDVTCNSDDCEEVIILRQGSGPFRQVP